MKRLIFEVIAVLAGGIVLISFSSCSKANEKKEGKAAVEEILSDFKKDAKKNPKGALSSLQDVVTKIDKVNSGIKVPGNLMDCPDKYFEGNKNLNCPKEPYCSYYTTTKNGQARTHNLEFTNECSLCSIHKKKGVEFHRNGDIVYTHLGYQKGKCYQGMYKGQ
jgi:hypothetical protein